jgi:hypothetical protein
MKAASHVCARDQGRRRARPWAALGSVLGLLALAPAAAAPAHAAWIGDNGSILFERRSETGGEPFANRTADSPGNWDLFVMDADGARERPLIAAAFDDLAPAWSADGRRVVFVRDHETATASTSSIVMAGANGRGKRTLLTAPQIIQDPALSPDGRFLIYEDDRKDADIYLMDLRSPGEVRRITPSDLPDDAPVWSPDGTRILYTADAPEQPAGNPREIYTMDPDGSDPRRLTFNGAADTAPAWSPDGTRIAWLSDLDGDLELFVMNADGGDQRQVTFDTRRQWEPNWSPDGRWIVFPRGDLPTSYLDTTNELVVIRPDGTGERELTDNAVDDHAPEWQPANVTCLRVLRRTAGADRVAVGRRGTRVLALEGDDVINGGPGGDCMMAGPGDDVVRAGSGADQLAGGFGNDRIDAGRGRDRVWGGPGNDRIQVADGRRDTVDCGPGRDRVVADEADRLSDCERVDRR